MAPPTPTIPTSKTLVVGPPTLLTRRLMASNSNGDMAKKISISPICSSFSSYGDPCHDLFFQVTRPETRSDEETTQQQQQQQQNLASLNYLKTLLPVAWSHNPLTTLKLIFNLHAIRSSSGKCYPEGFYTAVFWLHQKHPKTLLCNLPSIADSFGGLYVLIEILYRLLEQDQDAAERLHCDPDYQLLHDRAMDVFVERLKSDIDKMKQHKLDLKPSDYITDGDDDDDDEDDKDGTLDAAAYADLFVSEAAGCCVTNQPQDSHAARTISLCESIARRLCPPKSDQPNQSYQSEEWERIRNEVLAPLNRYWKRQGMFIGRQRSEVKMYLEEVKKAGGRGGNLSGHGSIIKPDAMLPNEIIRYVVEDGDVREGAELQWKAMVEDMYLKQQQQQKQGEGLGKFKNCLAVCHIRDYNGLTRLAVSLGLLVSELSEEPAWKGKVISSGHLPDQLMLHSIQGDDLKSKCEFMMRKCSRNLVSFVHKRKVLDFILEVAVKENLKAEQMVKKVFVFADYGGYVGGTSWKTRYEAKRREFKEKGYGDAVPHILVWNISDQNMPCIEQHHPGVTLLRGVSDNLVKSFLDNYGEIGPHHLMEAAIADKAYQALTVVD
ncbi:uncharacterized protein Pyn_36488 [Prunus yedoensis var. nudiflora]|uniref:Uncharacterized protein n=1 Tax=Prunus yedoensis var. nudiflora TaxID=2094558 RepID=A0A314XQN5_PRUYE|nr:uncharacterized protein Pyn_36488 [Prunus yedoensis var. nudiflora]